MKLLNHLYSIDTIAQSDEGIICTIRLIAGSPIYKAHFPMQPITPGACIVQMAVEMYEEFRVSSTSEAAEPITGFKFQVFRTSSFVLR